jgi:hypothetical protein
MVTDNRIKASVQVLGHVERAREALKEFGTEGARTHGVLANPRLQCTSLKWAQAELQRAVVIIERTKWR